MEMKYVYSFLPSPALLLWNPDRPRGSSSPQKRFLAAIQAAESWCKVHTPNLYSSNTAVSCVRPDPGGGTAVNAALASLVSGEYIENE